ncbi:MAG: S41 family peptidase [Pseudomonadales bacterium]|nr:S41 family peptidase [Pseudomonadales bacterium]
MARRRQENGYAFGMKLVLAFGCVMLTACGGGSGGSGSGPTPPIANIVEDPMVDDGSDPADPADGSAWEPGVFKSMETFAAMCASPREGGFPDIVGTVTDENNWLRSMSNDTYLWYDEIEDVDPGTIDNTLDYFDLMKTFAVTPAGNRKDRFHFTFETEAWKQLSGSGVSAGYGMEISIVSSTPPRRAIVAYTEPDTPATSVNLARGTEILEVDGVDLVNASGSANIDVLNAGLFPIELDATHEFLVRDLNASETRLVTMTSREIMSTPVQNVATIDTESGKVGYILFNDHIATSEQLLIDAVNELKEAEVSDLVLDLRYNGGGFLDIANEAAYMIAGSATEGLVFDELQFNDKHLNFDPVTGRLLTPTLFRTTARGFSATAGTALPTLELPRVFVLTSGGTCSASEAIINGLNGIDIEVIQIGSNTCGKPYGFYALDNCGTSYFTIQFRSVNAKGFGDYSDGFSPSSDVTEPSGTALPGCNVTDDLFHALGDPEEAKLATALSYRENGVCPERAVSARRLSVIGHPEGQVLKHEWLRNMTITP